MPDKPTLGPVRNSEISSHDAHYTCDEVCENLSARLDGEEASISGKKLMEHLAKCNNCSRYQSNLFRLTDRLCDEFTEDVDDERLWTRVMQEIQTTSGFTHAEPQFTRRRFIGASIAATLALGAGSAWLLKQTQSSSSLVAETVRDYETFQLRGGLLDVKASDSEDVMQWMSARLDFNLPADIATSDEYAIVGGRLCSFLNRRLAFFHYQKNSRDLALYVMKARGLQIPAKGSLSVVTTDKGLSAVTWQRDDLVYVLLSELPEHELTQFATYT